MNEEKEACSCSVSPSQVIEFIADCVLNSSELDKKLSSNLAEMIYKLLDGNNMQTVALVLGELIHNFSHNLETAQKEIQKQSIDSEMKKIITEFNTKHKSLLN